MKYKDCARKLSKRDRRRHKYFRVNKRSISKRRRIATPNSESLSAKRPIKVSELKRERYRTLTVFHTKFPKTV